MPTPDLNRAIAALKAADAAGDADAARKLAAYIRQAQGAQAAPTEAATPTTPGMSFGARVDAALAGSDKSFADRIDQLFADKVLNPGEGPLGTAGQAALNVLPGGKQVAAAMQAAFDPELSYADARRQQAAKLQAGTEQNPISAKVGAGGAIVAQLGGPKGVVNLLRSAPQLVRGLLSRGVLTPQALVAALRGAGTAAGYGVALSDADIPLAEGNFAEAGSKALEAATDPKTLLAGGTLGLAAGAASARLRLAAEAAAEKAAKVKELERVRVAEAERPAQVAAAKEAAKRLNDAAKVKDAEARAKAIAEAKAINAAEKAKFEFRRELAKRSGEVETARLQAEANARASQVTPDNAVRVFGLDRVKGESAGATRARAIRLMNEPVPTGTGETWMAAQQRFAGNVEGWQRYVDETKTALGNSIGQVRESLTKTGATVNAQALKDKLKAAIGPLPTEKAEKLLTNANRLVDEATEEGTVGASKLRQIIKNFEEAKAWNLRGAAVDLEKRLVAQHLPEQNESYKRLLNQWSDANALSRGAEGQFAAVNKGQRPIRFDTPEKVEPVVIEAPGRAPQVKPNMPPKSAMVKPNIPPKPEFGGGPDARAEAEMLLAPQFSVGQQILRSLIRAGGGAVGAAAGQGSGIPFAGYAGAASGYQTGNTLADRWIRATRPTVGGIIAESEAAARAMQRWEPHLEAALRRGPRVVTAVHRALMQADPDYREMMESTGRAALPPLTFGEFSNGWRGR